MPTQRILGIDFGTSTTVVRVKTYIDGQPEGGSAVHTEPIKFDGQDTLPSLVFWDSERKEYLTGYEAANAADGDWPGELYRNFKLDLRSGNPKVHEKAEALAVQFFRGIYQAYASQWEQLTPCDEEITYVSHPAAWPKDLMVRIAQAAGFTNVRPLDEPSAAIQTVLVQKGEALRQLGGQSLCVLMVDMGAGTTDLALCRYFPGRRNAEIISTWPQGEGYAQFGGREIDEMLLEYMKAYLADCGLPKALDDRRTYLPKSKIWKEDNVSPHLKTNRAVSTCPFCRPLLSFLEGQPKPFPVLDRAALERRLSGYLPGFPALIQGLLYNTPGLAPQDIDLVILTGGHSQWYFAEEILAGRLNDFGAVNLPKIQSDPQNRIISLSRPQETVALGLAYQGLIIPEPVREAPRPPRPEQPQQKSKQQPQAQQQPPSMTQPSPPVDDCQSYPCRYTATGIGTFAENTTTNVLKKQGILQVFANRLEFAFNGKNEPEYIIGYNEIAEVKTMLGENVLSKDVVRIALPPGNKYNPQKTVYHFFWMESGLIARNICGYVQISMSRMSSSLPPTTPLQPPGQPAPQPQSLSQEPNKQVNSPPMAVAASATPFAGLGAKQGSEGWDYYAEAPSKSAMIYRKRNEEIQMLVQATAERGGFVVGIDCIWDGCVYYHLDASVFKFYTQTNENFGWFRIRKDGKGAKQVLGFQIKKAFCVQGKLYFFDKKWCLCTTVDGTSRIQISGPHEGMNPKSMYLYDGSIYFNHEGGLIFADGVYRISLDGSIDKKIIDVKDYAGDFTPDFEKGQILVSANKYSFFGPGNHQYNYYHYIASLDGSGLRAVSGAELQNAKFVLGAAEKIE